MHELSPREIRITSPREMTPRMASKVAAAQAQLAQGLDAPPLPARRRSLPRSPLVNTSPDASTLPKSGSTPPALGAPLTSPKSAPPLITPKLVSDDLEKPSWPTVPYASPQSPKLNEMFGPNKPNSAGPSAESQRRAGINTGAVQQSVPSKPLDPSDPAWRPPRPPRPRSPKLEHQRSLSHTLSPELVDHLRSPPAASPDVVDGKRSKARLRSSGNIKALRSQMSAKNLNLKWSEGLKNGAETVGLFKNSDLVKQEPHDPSPQSSAAFGASGGVGEFGQENKLALVSPVDSIGLGHPSANAHGSGSAGGKHGFAQRFLSFGRRQTHASREGIPAPVITPRSVSAPKTSVADLDISSPIQSTLQHDTAMPRPTIPPIPATPPTQPGALPDGAPRRSASSARSMTSPTSPASAYSVKRKPVPSRGLLPDEDTMPRGESLQSLRSFTLDPPKNDEQLQFKVAHAV